MAPTRPSPRAESPDGYINFDLQLHMRQRAAELYKDKPWCRIENGLFVGELPPRTPDPHRWRTWKWRQEQGLRQRRNLAARAKRIARGEPMSLAEQHYHAVMNRRLPEDLPDRLGARSWWQVVMGDTAKPDPIIKKKEEDADVETSDVPMHCSPKSVLNKSHGNPGKLAFTKPHNAAAAPGPGPKKERGTIPSPVALDTKVDTSSPTKSAFDAEEPSNPRITSASPSFTPRSPTPIRPAKPISLEQLYPTTPSMITALEDTSSLKTQQPQLGERDYQSKYKNWRVRLQDTLELGFADDNNPDTPLNASKRDRQWRVIRLGTQGMENLVKPEKSGAGGKRHWERHCRVEKRTSRTRHTV